MGQNHGTDLTQAGLFKKVAVLLGVIIEVATVVLSKLTEARLQEHIGNKQILKKKLRKNLEDVFGDKVSYAIEKRQWTEFYQKYFAIGLPWDNTLEIPEKPSEGVWRLLIIAQSLTINQVYEVMSKAFKCWRINDDLNKAVSKNIRNTKTAYAIWVRDGKQPDEKYLGKSVNQADPDMLIGVTLLERMLHEIMFFDETGNHLDCIGVTVCTGSRYSDSYVPFMRSYEGIVRIDWSSLNSSDSHCGLREAVSL